MLFARCSLLLATLLIFATTCCPQAEEELEAQRSELGDYRRKVEGERKNYKRLLKAQEQKMRDHERQRAVAEERERQLYNTVREKDGEIHSVSHPLATHYLALAPSALCVAPCALLLAPSKLLLRRSDPASD